MTKTEQLYQALDRKISDLQAAALSQIKTRADRAASLNELRAAISDYTRTMDNAIIQACDTAAAERRELEKAAESPMLAILRYRSGREVDRLYLTDTDPLDCDHYAAIFSNNLGYELEGETEGRIPDGAEDYSITITDDPDGARCWSSANYMLKAE